MRIAELHVENFMGVEVVDVTPPEHVVTIGGRNGAGKSSVLNAIVAALGGAKGMPSEPLRSGAKKGKVVAKVSRPEGDLLVTRTIGEGGKTALTITTAEGAKLQRPQELLDSLVGSIGFDPHAFVRLDPRKQAEQLRELVGIDFGVLDESRAELYAERTAVNRDVKQQQSLVDSFQFHADAPASEVSVAELAEEMREREQQCRIIASGKEKAASLMREAERDRANAERCYREIERLQVVARECEQAAADAESEARRIREECDAITPPDVEEIREKIASAEDENAKVRENKNRAAAVVRLAELKARADDLTSQIKEVDEEKSRQLAMAPWPVEGLGFGESGGVTFNGRPFAQASSAEQLRVSLAMGMALNPKLRVLIIRDGSLIDDETMAAIQQHVEESNFQVFVEVVRRDGCSLVISEGRIDEGGDGGN